MRELFEYQLLQYYPSPKTEEFFNVGVYFANEKKVKQITSEHLSKLFINKQEKENIKKLLAMFNDNLHNQQWYSNHIKISKPKRIRTSMKIAELEHVLYSDNIGYKFEQHKNEYKTKKTIITEMAYSIVEKEFKGYASLKDDKYADFILVFSGYEKPFVVGSLFSDTDRFKAVNGIFHNKNNLSFGRTNDNSELEADKAKSAKVMSLLEDKLSIKVKPFYDEATIYNTIKSELN